jgi:hypothetical protein
MALLVYALLAFSGIAALARKMLRSASMKRPVETSPKMGNSPLPPNGAHFREMARELRLLARRCRYPGARKEMLELAASFDRRAGHLDAHQSQLADLDASGV